MEHKSFTCTREQAEAQSVEVFNHGMQVLPPSSNNCIREIQAAFSIKLNQVVIQAASHTQHEIQALEERLMSHLNATIDSWCGEIMNFVDRLMSIRMKKLNDEVCNLKMAVSMLRQECVPVSVRSDTSTKSGTILEESVSDDAELFETKLAGTFTKESGQKRSDGSGDITPYSFQSLPQLTHGDVPIGLLKDLACCIGRLDAQLRLDLDAHIQKLIAKLHTELTGKEIGVSNASDGMKLERNNKEGTSAFRTNEAANKDIRITPCLSSTPMERAPKSVRFSSAPCDAPTTILTRQTNGVNVLLRASETTSPECAPNGELCGHAPLQTSASGNVSSPNGGLVLRGIDQRKTVQAAKETQLTQLDEPASASEPIHNPCGVLEKPTGSETSNNSVLWRPTKIPSLSYVLAPVQDSRVAEQAHMDKAPVPV